MYILSETVKSHYCVSWTHCKKTGFRIAFFCVGIICVERYLRKIPRDRTGKYNIYILKKIYKKKQGVY